MTKIKCLKYKMHNYVENRQNVKTINNGQNYITKNCG